MVDNVKSLTVFSGAALLLLVFVFVGYILYPLAATAYESLHVSGAFSTSNYLQLLDPHNRGNWEAVGNSVFISLLSVLFGGIVGMLFAFVFTQYDFPLRGLVSRLAVLPIALPPLVGVIAFMLVYGESGMAARLLQKVLHTESVPFSLEGMGAIVVVHVYSFNVYFYLFISTALRGMDASVLEAAASLGSGAWSTFRRVVLPELRTALVGASILTFMASMASFSAPFLFGGGRRFMTTEIYSAKLNGELARAAAQSALLTVVSALFFVVLRASERSGAGAAKTRGTARKGVLTTPRWWRRGLLSLSLLLLVFELLPIVTIFLVSFVREGTWTWQLFPTSFTVENYLKLFDDLRGFVPLRNSVVMSTITLAASLLFGVAAAYILTKGISGRMKFLGEIAVTLPFAIPGTVVAINLIIAFNVPTLFSGYTVLVGTFWILPLAYFVRTYPLIVRSTMASLDKVDDTLLEAGASFGAGVFRRVRKIVMPLILPGVISGAQLLLIATLGEFVSSIMLYTYSSRPIAIEILSQLRAYNFGAAAAYSVFLLGLISLLTIVSYRIPRRTGPESQGPSLSPGQ
jgi:iron(III) transport system permease protein